MNWRRDRHSRTSQHHRLSGNTTPPNERQHNTTAWKATQHHSLKHNTTSRPATQLNVPNQEPLISPGRTLQDTSSNWKKTRNKWHRITMTLFSSAKNVKIAKLLLPKTHPPPLSLSLSSPPLSLSSIFLSLNLCLSFFPPPPLSHTHSLFLSRPPLHFRGEGDGSVGVWYALNLMQWFLNYLERHIKTSVDDARLGW